jgi:uncharacterized protein (TIGR02996 family)
VPKILTTEDAFLADILASPKDDTLRLIYADYLEEQGKTDRADLIRVQIRLAEIERLIPTQVAFHSLLLERDRLIHRQERLLTPSLFWDWFVGSHTPLARIWPGSPAVRIDQGICEIGYFEGDSQPESWHLSIRRGFIEKVSLPQSAWLKWGRTLVGWQPLTRVDLSDKSPRAIHPKVCWRVYEKEFNRPASHHLDLVIYSFLTLGLEIDTVGWMDYETEEAAREDLSNACLTRARSRTDS